MERIRVLRDSVTKNADKKCCIKVAVGVAVVLVLLIVIIVAAVLSTTEENSDPVNNKEQQNGSGTGTTSGKLEGLDIPSQYLLRMGSLESPSFHQILAVDDEHQAYIMQIDEDFKNIYVVVNFQQKSQVFVGMRKEHERGDVVESTMLFCHESKFDSDFTGSFLSSSQLTTGDHSAVSNGRTTDLNVDEIGTIYKASPLIASVINGSCSYIPSHHMIQWKEKKSECTISTTIDNNTSPCSLQCPKCKDLAQTEKQSCSKFDQCNFDMSYCDPYWKSNNVYNQQPYCICRKTLANDMLRVSCPKSGADGGNCEIPRRTIVDFENSSPCFCRYSIPIIHPYIPVTGNKNTMFTLQSVIVTAPAQTHKECELRDSS
ncbi:hypothetical protein LOTGIDRAFT_232427 [Lottia gigantea]|uniref:Uncharacterized protein n=1 Tax=Lottia gigantea TaxID=225164 RepID=V4ABH1_LOTGI|nr:hypothetical protein LOTGIDRAFT_232427 [Lottia gigantea]ESO94162.1 hypothetical protein LOTGIDRAFT_232427 [Lottia gigantea]